MQNKIIKLDPRDNALIALTDLKQGEEVRLQNASYIVAADIPAKHKFASADLAAGGDVIMYGVLVGKATETIRKGDLLTTRNIHHQAALFHDRVPQLPWWDRWGRSAWLALERRDLRRQLRPASEEWQFHSGLI